MVWFISSFLFVGYTSRGLAGNECELNYTIIQNRRFSLSYALGKVEKIAVLTLYQEKQ